MSSFARRVHRTIRQRRLLAAGDRVAAAVSGGADSVALALVLLELAASAPWSFAGIVHVHHGARPGEADEDEAFVRELGDRLGLPVDVVRADVPALVAQSAGRSFEAVARDVRYAALEAAGGRLGASRIATGHTLDDQAETVMLRLLRGSSLRGVSGVRASRGAFVRPLIECSRRELRSYLEGRGETFREDSSNLDLRIPRNALRHRLMPVIEELWPAGVRALARFADQAADDERYLAAAARQAIAPRQTGEGGVQLIRETLEALPPAIARRVLRDALEAAGGRASFADIETVRRLLDQDRAAVDLHRIRVVVDHDLVRFEPPVAAGWPAGLGEYRLPVPGLVRMSETDTTIQASFSTGGHVPQGAGGDPARAVLQRASVTLPLMVRSRRDGDRLRPLGAPGSRKVQDLFVDRKVPRNLRDQVPLVVDASGRIVWVAGLAIADDCRVTAPDAGMVILEMKKGTQ